MSDELRGQNIGSQILKEIEQAAKKRGCTQCLLDTLNFQAMPFYEKHGYQTQWVQQGYPKTGCKYYMLKAL
jgi:ribosomal protein S18 acetylase RimI-like enzyme